MRPAPFAEVPLQQDEQGPPEPFGHSETDDARVIEQRQPDNSLPLGSTVQFDIRTPTFAEIQRMRENVKAELENEKDEIRRIRHTPMAFHPLVGLRNDLENQWHRLTFAEDQGKLASGEESPAKGSVYYEFARSTVLAEIATAKSRQAAEAYRNRPSRAGMNGLRKR